jgi:hypothetical protein
MISPLRTPRERRLAEADDVQRAVGVLFADHDADF